MIRNFIRIAPLIAVMSLLAACGDDKEAKPKKRNLGFTTETLTVNEADGTIEIEVTLDKPAVADVTIDFSISGGTARDVETANEQNLFADYEILNDDFEIEIEKGETSGTIEIEIFTDIILEENETIELKIDKVSSEDVVISTEDEIEITVEQQKGLLVSLQWEDEATADLDLMLWLENENGELGLVFISETALFRGVDEFLDDGEIVRVQTSLLEGTFGLEYFFLPNSSVEDGNLGLSATYWGTAAEPGAQLEFAMVCQKIADGGENDGEAVVMEGTYSDANINPWTEEDGENPLVAVTFTKDGDDWTDFDMTLSETGSRRPSAEIPAGIKKGAPMPRRN